jgi:hypothetical protein
MCTPVASGGVNSYGWFMPANIVIEPGELTSHRARWKVSAIPRANTSPSLSPVLYTITARSRPANGRSLSAISCCCCGVNRRHATRFSMSRRALFSASNSTSEIVCRCMENPKTPASPANSPTRPATTMMIKASLGHSIHSGSLLCSSRYSPIAPKAKRAPNTRRAISEVISPISVADFDNEKSKKYPVSPYTLLGAAGIALTGIALAILYLLGRRL